MDDKTQIVARVLNAQINDDACDQLISDYLPFIKSETSKTIQGLSFHLYEDSLSIAMFAFYEAIQSYSRLKGAFLSFAALHIKHRIIDYLRKENKYNTTISLNTKIDGQDDLILEDMIEDKHDVNEDFINKESIQKELVELHQQLAGFNLTLCDIADTCPKQDKTSKACMEVIEFIKHDQSLMSDVITSGKLPLASIDKVVKIPRKTIERHRKYILALIIIYSNGYELIRGHLRQLPSNAKGGN